MSFDRDCYVRVIDVKNPAERRALRKYVGPLVVKDTLELADKEATGKDRLLLGCYEVNKPRRIAHRRRAKVYYRVGDSLCVESVEVAVTEAGRMYCKAQELYA